MVLFQAFEGGSSYSPKDVWAEAWCIKDDQSFSTDDYDLMIKHMLDNKLIELSGEPDHYKITRLGEQVANGLDYRDDA
jgi:hypothetical protein